MLFGFNYKNIMHYFIAICVIGVLSFLAKQFHSAFTTDENAVIRNYLLNDSPLYGYNLPKLWIHNSYDINARDWLNTTHRNSTEINQPYIHHTIQTVVNYCGRDFNICLIDDGTFNRLLPSWDVDVASMAEPERSRARKLGLLNLIYHYGGIVVPNSFICTRNLIELYNDTEFGNKPFSVESPNHTTLLHNAFLPGLSFFGAPKNSPHIKSVIDELKRAASMATDIVSSKPDIVGDTEAIIIREVQQFRWNVVDASLVGLKSIHDGKPLTIDDMLEERGLPLSPDTFGLWLPYDEILSRHKYAWFAVMPSEELLAATKLSVIRLLNASLAFAQTDYTGAPVVQSLVTL